MQKLLRQKDLLQRNKEIKEPDPVKHKGLGSLFLSMILKFKLFLFLRQYHFSFFVFSSKYAGIISSVLAGGGGLKTKVEEFFCMTYDILNRKAGREPLLPRPGEMKNY